jgi:hypothetical protein
MPPLAVGRRPWRATPRLGADADSGPCDCDHHDTRLAWPGPERGVRVPKRRDQDALGLLLARPDNDMDASR